MSDVFKIPTCIPDLTDYIVKGEHPEATNSHYHISKCTWDRPNYSPITVAVKVIRVLQPWISARDTTNYYKKSECGADFRTSIFCLCSDTYTDMVIYLALCSLGWRMGA
ncbi:hypothetical protein BDR07DRAFT_774946 [Suillus spraguei]|nr:hypothetical protein BDR07DRAFT_774946 [Suillus spraguei]